VANLKASYAAVLGFIHEHGIVATYFALQLGEGGAVTPAAMTLELFISQTYPFRAPHVRFFNNCHNFQLEDHLLYPHQLFLWRALADRYSAQTRQSIP
jgi:hypothetical protein